ncbi:hypothetical protein CONLIGDRAFT_153799 [Coniochaeta ligniaria NRRL 30616]|uniref:Zn(2)-C6 fungal-type domain-containing protein n=1 Tax=Coniochaeta ligniaria NRRL 30616 TaxID=1408157 RepID=A0A1J7J099_9PEZI|nr:hypothetical protein CONLIGDRAFT_153799 [Coniochaeta ligniaria NRRL 30616]
MKAKACTKCRQWKARCDASDGVPGGCSRCRSLNLACVFDVSFKRLSKGKRLQQMSTEIQQLRQALHNSATSNASTSPQAPQQSEGDTINVTVGPGVWETQLQGTSDGTAASPSIQLLPQLSADPVGVPTASLTVPYRTLGEVGLTRSQVDRYFKTYFARHHPHLPFKVNSESPDEVYSRSSLLFWIICAVTSSWKLQSQLAPMIKSMIADTIHAASHSVDTIQALLIMCIWPFKTARLSEDPSHFYCSIATQMSLELGLHRPSQPYWPLRHGSLSGPSTVGMDQEIRLTTWLACYVVNQMQSSHMGLPSSTAADANLLAAFGSPAVEPSLSQLCRIYHLLMQSSWEISANAPTPTGMLDPAARLTMIRHYRKQLAALEQLYLGQMDDVVRISLLYSRLQLCSFALLDDVPLSEGPLDLVSEAEATACELIELTYGMNLSIAPIYARRAMCYGVFVLVRLLQLPYDVQREMLHDSIERARQSLSTTINTPDDISGKACTILQDLLYVEDKHRSPPILSRMGASIFYDTFRVYWEQCLERQMPIEYLDLDRFDWAALGV